MVTAECRGQRGEQRDTKEMGRQEPIREVRRSITGIGRAPEQAHGTDRRAYEDAESPDRTSVGLAAAEERGTVQLQRRCLPAFTA
tara:strand:- start:1168 stop:1422 length:255 start_codon:yes stop_codon:yes gene_type:complete